MEDVKKPNEKIYIHRVEVFFLTIGYHIYAQNLCFP